MELQPLLVKRTRNSKKKYLLLAVFISFLNVFGQTGAIAQTNSYSTLAQKELDDYATANPNNANNLDVFKFSIEDITDSNDTVVMGSNNKPTIYGKTDYDSEFKLENDLDTSLKMAADVLSKMGFRKYTLQRQIQNFIKYDEAIVRRLAQENKDEKNYIFKAKEELEQQERSLNEDFKRGIVEFDSHWDSEQIRETLKKA